MNRQPDNAPDTGGSDPMKAREWEDLEAELTRALRMGPGGLTEAQRSAILEAAAHPVVVGMGGRNRTESQPAPSSRFLLLKGLGVAAAVAILLLMVRRHMSPPGGGDSERGFEQSAPVAQEDSGVHIRILPGETVGSHYTPKRPSGLTRVLTPEGDWSAIGAGGGFQPAVMANVAELIPAPALPDAPDILPVLLGIERRPEFAAKPADLINHFSYGYPAPAEGEAISVTVESGPCPWNPVNKLVHIGMRASSNPRSVPGRQGVAASDVRILVDFNPARVSAYRPVGHNPGERRMEGARFERGGAELLAGQSVTVIYEVVPVGGVSLNDDGARWKPVRPASVSRDSDLLTAKVTYRKPGNLRYLEKEVVLEDAVDDKSSPRTPPSEDFRFVSAVAACTLLMEDAPGMQHYNIKDALALARGSVGKDPGGKRTEFVRLLAEKQGK